VPLSVAISVSEDIEGSEPIFMPFAPIPSMFIERLLSMSAEGDGAAACAPGPGPAGWQSECAWRSQQDRSQAEAQAEVGIIRTDKMAANKLVARGICPNITPVWKTSTEILPESAALVEHCV
jgi:hypothetical protein